MKDIEIDDTDSIKPLKELTASTDKSEEMQTIDIKKEQVKLDNALPKCLEFANNLLTEWSALKEVFRIPKKERIEQMKEHEREAGKLTHYINVCMVFCVIYNCPMLIRFFNTCVGIEVIVALIKLNTVGHPH